jgi:hypothetical protein
MKHQVGSDSIRLLSGTDSNRLLAFDAQLHGGGFRYGDGKTDRYYVDGWIKTSQSVSWPFRVNEAIQVEITIRYQTDKESGGVVKASLAGQNFMLDVKPSGDKPEIKTVVLGKCLLKPGVDELKLLPEKISGKNLMQLFEVNLNPIK